MQKCKMLSTAKLLLIYIEISCTKTLKVQKNTMIKSASVRVGFIDKLILLIGQSKCPTAVRIWQTISSVVWK